MILFVGALLGFVSVVFGAYASHGLHGSVSDEVFHSVTTAIRYNQVHAVAVAAVGLALLQPGTARTYPALAPAAWLFIAGTVLFSFSIYLAAVLGAPALTGAAPAGGVALMGGWLGLAWTGLRSLAS